MPFTEGARGHFYITFVGFLELPILRNQEYFLYPIGGVVVLFILARLPFSGISNIHSSEAQQRNAGFLIILIYIFNIGPGCIFKALALLLQMWAESLAMPINLIQTFNVSCLFCPLRT